MPKAAIALGLIWLGVVAFATTVLVKRTMHEGGRINTSSFLAILWDCSCSSTPHLLLLISLSLFPWALLIGNGVENTMVPGHPVRVLLTVSLVIAAAWLTDNLVVASMSRRRRSFWGVLTGAASGVLVFLVSSHWAVTRPAIHGLLGDEGMKWSGIALITLIVVMYLRVYGRWLMKILSSGWEALWPRAKGEKLPMVDLSLDAHELGQLVSLIVMVLAMFAFGLRVEKVIIPINERIVGQPIDRDQLTVEWRELPAILIVVVLVELGVSLVAHARDASTGARAASDAATAATTQLTGVSKTTKDDLARLEKMLKVTGDLIESRLWKEADILMQSLALQGERFWTNLHGFVTSWLPAKGRSNGSALLVRELFEAFIGAPNKGPGSVYNSGGAISCVTLDSVFVGTSRRWLSVLETEAGENRRLVVWAVTSLLPTDFAFPGIWWSGPSAGHGRGLAERPRDLNAFTGVVLDTCKSRNVDHYRRITAINEDQLNALTDPSVLVDTKTIEKPLESLKHTLDNWYVWDPRMDHKFVFGEVLTRSREVVQAFCEPNRMYAGYAISRKALAEFFSAPFERFADAYHLLPYVGSQAKHDALFFVNNFGGPSEEKSGYVLGCSDELLKQPAKASELRRRGVDESIVERMLSVHGANADVCLADVLRCLGWLPLREWYVGGLHKGNHDTKSQAGVWTLENNETLGNKPKLYEHMTIRWGEFAVSTLDLLFIGIQTPGEEPDWQGAACSNLEFSRVECSVKLVTEEQDMKRIEKAVTEVWGKTKDWQCI